METIVTKKRKEMPVEWMEEQNREKKPGIMRLNGWDYKMYINILYTTLVVHLTTYTKWIVCVCMLPLANSRASSAGRHRNVPLLLPLRYCIASSLTRSKRNETTLPRTSTACAPVTQVLHWNLSPPFSGGTQCWTNLDQSTYHVSFIKWQLFLDESVALRKEKHSLFWTLEFVNTNRFLTIVWPMAVDDVEITHLQIFHWIYSNSLFSIKWYGQKGAIHI